MTPEAQHQAIASLCGYYLIHDEESDSVALRNGDVNFRGSWHRAGDDGDQFAWEDAPDYLSDLNAMHEAAACYFNPRGAGEGFIYINNLCRVTETKADYVSFALIHATAAQRAEAFLRTLGKWDDTK